MSETKSSDKSNSIPNFSFLNTSLSANAPIDIIKQILTTVHTMINDRGYTTILKKNWSEENKTMKDLKVIGYQEKTNDTVYIYFATETKVHIEKMREYILHMRKNNIQHSIIIYAKQITPSAKNIIPQDYDIEAFSAKSLIVNPMYHFLVPKHEKIESEEEAKKILKQYYATHKNKLPRYDPNEPIVRYNHWKEGTVVKIYRKSGNQKDPEIYYRHVRSAF